MAEAGLHAAADTLLQRLAAARFHNVEHGGTLPFLGQEARHARIAGRPLQVEDARGLQRFVPA